MTLLLAVLAGVLAGPAVVEVSGLLRAKTRKGQRRAGACLPGVRRVRRLAGQVPDDLAGRIEAAQLPRSVDARAVMGLKGLLATIAAVAAFAGASLQALPGSTLVLLVAPVLAFLAPDLVLRRMGRRTQGRVAAEVPEVAARLHLAVTAGLPPVKAAAAACAPSGGVLAREMAAAAARVEAGASFPAQLDRLTLRCPDGDVRALAGALRRSQEHGTDISGLLEEIAIASRRRESLRIRDRAQRAGPKIQLAVALLLVPAAMCLIAAALLSGLFWA